MALVKRGELLRRLKDLGVEFVREGGSHSVYKNPRTGQLLFVPRHTEIKENLARGVLRDAEKGS